MKIPIFSPGRIDLWYCGMHVARTCRACIIGLLGVVDVSYIMYFVSCKATVMILSTKIHPTSVGRGINFRVEISHTGDGTDQCVNVHHPVHLLQFVYGHTTCVVICEHCSVFLHPAL